MTRVSASAFPKKDPEQLDGTEEISGESTFGAWSLRIDLDGWVFRVGREAEKRVTGSQAGTLLGKHGRTIVLSQTRRWLGRLGTELAKSAYVPVSGSASSGISASWPAAQMAQAGRDITRLSEELGEFEATPPG